MGHTNSPGTYRRLDLASLEAGRVVEVKTGRTTYWMTTITAAYLDHSTRTIVHGVAMHSSDGSVQMQSPFNIAVQRDLKRGKPLMLDYAGQGMAAVGDRPISTIRVLEPPTAAAQLDINLNRLRAQAESFNLELLPPGSVVTLSSADARQVYFTTVLGAEFGNRWVRGIFVQSNWRRIMLPSPYDSMASQFVGAGLHPYCRTSEGETLLLADHVLTQSLNNLLP